MGGWCFSVGGIHGSVKIQVKQLPCRNKIETSNDKQNGIKDGNICPECGGETCSLPRVGLWMDLGW